MKRFLFKKDFWVGENDPKNDSLSKPHQYSVITFQDLIGSETCRFCNEFCDTLWAYEASYDLEIPTSGTYLPIEFNLSYKIFWFEFRMKIMMAKAVENEPVYQIRLCCHLGCNEFCDTFLPRIVTFPRGKALHFFRTTKWIQFIIQIFEIFDFFSPNNHRLCPEIFSVVDSRTS